MNEYSYKKALRRLAGYPEESEKEIEKYLAAQVKAAGGICLKFASATETGYPDRLICIPGGQVAWVEVKSKGKKSTKLQILRHARLRELGMRVYVTDSKDGVRQAICEIFNLSAFSDPRQ